MRQVNLNFQIGKIWQEKLSQNHSQTIKSLHEESHEAMTTILDMLENDWDSKVTRFPICIETSPFAKTPMRKYCMASEEEFRKMKQDNPDLVIRTLNQEEMLSLTQQEEDLQ